MELLVLLEKVNSNNDPARVINIGSIAGIVPLAESALSPAGWVDAFNKGNLAVQCFQGGHTSFDTNHGGFACWQAYYGQCNRAWSLSKRYDCFWPKNRQGHAH